MSSRFNISEKPSYSLSDFEFIHNPNDKSAKLGVGSFASVKLAREKKSGKLFAIKVMNISPQKASASDLHNLKAEITIHKKLDHTNIIKYHGYIQQDPNVYLVLDYAENGNLYSYLHKKKSLSESEVFKYFHQACLAFDYIHQNNVMHRDLKPENLLLDKNFDLKLCDFGWATQNINDKRLTFCGTYEYMAPEIVHKTPYDYRIDVWSLGILLFELLHRDPPYKGRTLPEITKSLNRKTITFSSAINPDAKDLILRILRVNSSERLSIKNILVHPWVKAQLAKHSPQSETSSVLSVDIPQKPQIKLSEDPQTSPTTASSLPEFSKHFTASLKLQGSLTTTHKSSNQKTRQPYHHPTYATPSTSSIPYTALASSKSKETWHYKDLQNDLFGKYQSNYSAKSSFSSHMNSFAHGNYTTRDKENPEFRSFVSFEELAKQKDDGSSYVSLRTLADHYPATTTNKSSKNFVSYSRQLSDNTANQFREAGRKNTYESNNAPLSSPLLLKVTDDNTDVPCAAAPSYDYFSDRDQTLTDTSERRPLSSSINRLNQNSNVQRENAYPLQSGRRFEDRDVRSKLVSPRGRKHEVPSAYDSYSSKYASQQEITGTSTGSFCEASSATIYKTHYSPSFRHKKDSNLTGSFAGTGYPRQDKENEAVRVKVEMPSDSRALKENNKPSASHNKQESKFSMSSTFNQFYRDLELKKFQPGARSLSKENDKNALHKLVSPRSPVSKLNA